MWQDTAIDSVLAPYLSCESSQTVVLCKPEPGSVHGEI